MRTHTRIARRVAPLAALSVLLLGLSAAPASAQVTALPAPFAGTLTESFEGFPTGSATSPLAVFGGQGSLATTFPYVYAPGSVEFGLVLKGFAQVADGAQGLGLDGANQTATITFTGTVLQFGGFWNAAGGVSDNITVNFFDPSSALIDSVVIDPTDSNALQWFGWSSGTPIKTVTYTGNGVVVDALRASNSVIGGPGAAAPEPGTLALLGVAGVGGLLAGGFARRKR